MRIADSVQIGDSTFTVRIIPSQRGKGFVVSLKDDAETWANTQIEDIAHANIAIKDLVDLIEYSP